MKPRRYKGVCPCGMTKFFPSPAPANAKYKSLYTNSWNTDLGAGYPGTGAAHSFDKDVSSCMFCKCEVGLSRSGRPYMREYEDESESPKKSPNVPRAPKDWEAVELEWFEDE